MSLDPPNVDNQHTANKLNVKRPPPRNNDVSNCTVYINRMPLRLSELF